MVSDDHTRLCGAVRDLMGHGKSARQLIPARPHPQHAAALRRYDREVDNQSHPERSECSDR